MVWIQQHTHRAHGMPNWPPPQMRPSLTPARWIRDAQSWTPIIGIREWRPGAATQPCAPPAHSGTSRLACAAGTTISRRSKGYAGEYEYSLLGPPSRGSSRGSEVPFKPTHPNKSGFQGTLSKFPEYLAGTFSSTVHCRCHLPAATRQQSMWAALLSRLR
jgi:hypothetical protein